MRQGTTPTHTFTLPFPASEVQAALISYAQDGHVLFQKTLAECNVGDKQLSLTLSQEETFQFSPGRLGLVQVRILGAGNKALSSDVITFPVEPSLSKEVLK